MQSFKEAAEITNLGAISFSQLACTFPLPAVKEILERLNRATWRMRKLPSELMFYFPMLMSLDKSDSATDTLLKLLEEDKKVFGRRSEAEAGKGGISEARIRLGYEPLKEAFDAMCVPLARKVSPHTHFEGMLIVAIDGVVMNVVDTAANQEFGRSTNQNKRPGANPQARVVGLVECGTHAMIAAEIGNYTDSEVTLARSVLLRLPANSLTGYISDGA